MKEQINSLLSKIGLKAIEVSLEQMKLIDGMTMIEAEVFEVGANVSVLSEDGEAQPLPVGEYELEDSRILVVAEEGIIAEIKDAVSEEEEAPVEEVPVEASEKPATQVAKKVVESVVRESHFSKEDFETLLAKVSELELKLSAKEEAKVEEVEVVEMAKSIKHNPEPKKSNMVIGNESLIEFLNKKK